MTKHVKAEKVEEKSELSLQIQRGPRDLSDAYYPYTDPHSFIRVGFPGRCQLLLHTIEQAKRVRKWDAPNNI